MLFSGRTLNRKKNVIRCSNSTLKESVLTKMIGLSLFDMPHNH